MPGSRVLLPLCLAALVGCRDDDNNNKPGWAEKTRGELTVRTGSASTDASGIAEVRVPVSDGDVSFLLHATAGTATDWPSVEYIRSPSGATVLDWRDWYGDLSLTAAVYPEAQDVMVNWPVRPEDGALSPGDWTVGIGVTDDEGYYVSSVGLDLVLHTRTDNDGLSAGTVEVQILYASGVESEAEAVSGTEAAVARWREVWAAYGLDLVVTYGTADADPNLGALEGPDADIQAVSADAADEELVVLIGETVDGSLDYLGIAGGIPGPLAESARGAIVVSWLANAGADGRFSEDDIRLYGETLAHEVGHYTGLFHPVEDGWSAWDALDDTARCSGTNACEQDLGDNLMFPYPVCGFSSCTPQDQLSNSQAGVMHRYTGTL